MMQTSASNPILPMALLQSPEELNAPESRATSSGENDFWLGLATRLEQMEGFERVLPENVQVEDLAAWLAAGLSGENLPGGGNPLPVAPPDSGPVMAEEEGLAVQRIEWILPEGMQQIIADARRLLSEAISPGAPVQQTGPALNALSGLALTMTEALTRGRTDGAGLPGPLAGTGTSPDDISLGVVSAMLRGLAGRMAAAPDGTGTSGAAAVPLQDSGNGPGAALTRSLASEGLLETRIPGVLDALNAQTTAFRPMTASDLVAQLANGEPEVDPRSIRAIASGSAATVAPESGTMQTTPGNTLLGKGYGSLDVPLNQPGWDQALGNRVRWMLNEKLLVAEIKLNPPHLGALEIRVMQEGDRTSIQFIAPQAAVRDALDGALQRLRDLFQESGLNLGDVTVSQQGGGENNQPGGDGDDGQNSLAGTDGEAAQNLAGEGTQVGTPQGLVDFYA
jgi:hypothetical protein